MYAQLCLRLVEDAPNFEDCAQSGGTSTFYRLLIAKCQDEFENRSKAFSAFDKKGHKLSPEEKEQQIIAKRKMLGNIKFVGELGKLGLLHETILHKCIKQLLDKKKTVSLKDTAEDLECLCQIMKTVGHRLDTTRAKALMDQYFDRMETLAANTGLTARIRFMLQDVIDLRKNKWTMRVVHQDNSPRTIEQVHKEAAKDSGMYIPPYNPPKHQQKNFLGNKTNGHHKRGGMNDIFLSDSDYKLKPGMLRDMDIYPAGHHRNQGYQNQYGGEGGGSRHQKDMNTSGGGNGGATNKSNQIAPRFQMKKPLNSDEISLRPSKDSMVKLGGPSTLPPSARLLPTAAPALRSASPTPPPAATTRSASPQQQQQQSSPLIARPGAQVTIKPAAASDKPKQTKKPALTKEEFIKLLDSSMSQYLNSGSAENFVNATKDAKPPKKFLPLLVRHLASGYATGPAGTGGDKEEGGWELVGKLLATLRDSGVLAPDHIKEGFLSVMRELANQDSSLSRPDFATCAAKAMASDLLTLADLADPLVKESSSDYPLLLLLLQKLHEITDEDWLLRAFNHCKIDLKKMFKESEVSNEKMMEALEERRLGFLYPLLRIRADMAHQLALDPGPTALYKWIRDHVAARFHRDPPFIFILTSLVLKHVGSEGAAGAEQQQSVDASKALEREKAALAGFKPLLQRFLHEDTSLQLSALYAIQIHCRAAGFPKGMLLRLFMMFYDMEIVEEEAYLKWREDINDDYPGKGKALFQVNQWLSWLETADEEDSDHDEEDHEGGYYN